MEARQLTINMESMTTTQDRKIEVGIAGCKIRFQSIKREADAEEQPNRVRMCDKTAVLAERSAHFSQRKHKRWNSFR